MFSSRLISAVEEPGVVVGLGVGGGGGGWGGQGG